LFGGFGENLEKMLKPKKKILKKQKIIVSTIRIGSGELRVARGGSGAKAPPLAVRPKDVPVTSLM